MSVVITGVDAIDNKLRYMHDNVSNKVAKVVLQAGSSRAAQNIRRHIKKTIKPRSVEKGIGNRIVKASGNKGAVVTAKAGVGVGKAFTNNDVSVRKGRKGVVVTSRNLHWFALGTKPRYTSQGRMSRRNAAFRKGAGKLTSTGGKKHYTGRIEKEKFGGFVKNYGATDVLRRMEEKCTTEIAKLVRGGVSGAAEARFI